MVIIIQYLTDQQIPLQDILALYQDVGWSAYTSDPQTLAKAYLGSLCTISAWDGAQLVGLIRVVGDGATILYIQDLLVLEKYQRHGIGSSLLAAMIQQFQAVRQIVLTTDDTVKTRTFYEKCGFESMDKLSCVSFCYAHPARQD